MLRRSHTAIQDCRAPVNLGAAAPRRPWRKWTRHTYGQDIAYRTRESPVAPSAAGLEAPGARRQSAPGAPFLGDPTRSGTGRRPLYFFVASAAELISFSMTSIPKATFDAEALTQIVLTSSDPGTFGVG
jgi:hypothetical protein